MTILQAKYRLHEKWMQLTKDGTDEEMMQALSIADTILGNYDENLKADKLTMLNELKMEIEELKNEPACCQHFVRGIRRSLEVIQEKINALKGANNERN